MKVIFIRHGKSEGNKFGLVQGHLDFNLVDEGRRQALQAAGEIQKIIGKKKPLVFSSDLIRAWETAVIIAEELNLTPPIPDHRLRERHMGVLQDRHWTTINWEHVNCENPTIANLESRKDFIRRIHDFLFHILKHREIISDTVIVVTHGGTLVFIYHMLLGMALEDVPHLHNATLHTFRVNLRNNRVTGKKIDIKNR